jgi:hypothetical protein
VTDTIRRWLEEVNSSELISTGTRNHIATANMGIFQQDAESYEELTESEIVEFIDQAFRAYVEKLQEVSGDFWFYSWVDEMSGTLRCSAAPATSVNDLPFKCRLASANKSRVIAKAFLACPYKKGIPNEELGDSRNLSEGDQFHFVLTVYARPFADGSR